MLKLGRPTPEEDAARSPFILENETLRLEFEPATGLLVGATGVETGWEILNRPHLGQSFRLLIPLPDRRNNLVLGEEQQTTSVEVSSDKRRAVLVWDSVHSQHGGKHDIKLTLEVSLDERQAVFAMTVENHCEFIIENVYSPCFGDVQRPPEADWFKTFLWNIHGADEWPLWPTYQSLRGYHGTRSPTQITPRLYPGGDYAGPLPPFILLRGPKQGLYFGLNKPSTELVAWISELRPGWSSFSNSRVPDGNTVDGKDVALWFAPVHVPYILPGESRALTPIAVEVFQGGWQHGADVYKRWRNGWSKPPQTPSWLRDPHAWHQVGMNTPEDDYRISYGDLIRIGEACVQHGIRGIQLTGWNLGGQDKNLPAHEVDPRMGTLDEMKAAIAQVQAMGVKVVPFSKFTWADRSTERFRNELIRLAIKDPHGDYYVHPGYQYSTATQLLEINTKRLVPMCFLSEDYLALCNEEFTKLLHLGVDGILFDECLHHTPAYACFDSEHGHRYGAPVYANDLKLIDNFSLIARQTTDEFLFVGEACYDWEFEVYHMAYIRSGNQEHIPLMRYLRPEVPIMSAILGFNDRHMINQCLMYRYILSYEPYFIKGELKDFPLTLQYGQQMDQLRTELREYFWDGEFRHEIAASVFKSNGQPHRPYSTFVSQKTGKIGVVVTNYAEEETITVTVKPDDGSELRRYRLVDDPEWRMASDGITIPPRSAAVVVA